MRLNEGARRIGSVALRVLKTALDWVAAFFSYIESAITWMARNANPLYLGRGCVLVLAVSIPLALWYNSSWMDRLTVIGFCVTAVGFLYTIYQLFYAKTVALEAKDAWDRAASEMRAQHYHYCLEQTRTFMTEVKRLVQDRKWSLAAIRADDLSASASHLHAIRPQVTNQWEVFSTQFHTWAIFFTLGKTNKPLAQDLTSWNALLHSLRLALDVELAPLTFNQG